MVKKSVSGNSVDIKKENKDELKAKKKLDRQNKSKIKVTIGDKSFMVPKEMIAEHSKKEYPVKENSKKIANAQVAVLYLRESGIADLKYVRPQNGMFIVDGRYYHTTGSCIFNLGKKRIPLAVIPEWSFVPLSRKEYEKVMGSKYQEAQLLIIKSLENAEIVKINQDGMPKSKGDAKVIVWILIAAVVGLFMLNKWFGG